MSEINFINAPVQGDIIELGIEATHFGRTSLTLRCMVRNKLNHLDVLTVDRIVMVNLGVEGKPSPHGKTQIEFVKDRLE